MILGLIFARRLWGQDSLSLCLSTQIYFNIEGRILQWWCPGRASTYTVVIFGEFHPLEVFHGKERKKVKGEKCLAILSFWPSEVHALLALILSRKTHISCPIWIQVFCNADSALLLPVGSQNGKESELTRAWLFLSPPIYPNCLTQFPWSSLPN